MKSFLESFGGFIIGIVVFIAIVNLALFFIYGGLWLSERALSWLFIVIWIVFILDIFIIIPLGLFKYRKAKEISAIGLIISSYVFGLTLWLWTLLLTYMIWGMIAVIIGLLITGIGVVPIALLATVINGEWSVAVQIIMLIIFTFGSRMLGYYFAERVDDFAYEQNYI